jgi:hypothetical protein
MLFDSKSLVELLLNVVYHIYIIMLMEGYLFLLYYIVLSIIIHFRQFLLNAFGNFY